MVAPSWGSPELGGGEGKALERGRTQLPSREAVSGPKYKHHTHRPAQGEQFSARGPGGHSRLVEAGKLSSAPGPNLTAPGFCTLQGLLLLLLLLLPGDCQVQFQLQLPLPGAHS